MWVLPHLLSAGDSYWRLLNRHAQEGDRVKKEWTVGHLQPSSLTWLDHLAPPVAQ